MNTIKIKVILIMSHKIMSFKLIQKRLVRVKLGSLTWQIILMPSIMSYNIIS